MHLFPYFNFSLTKRALVCEACRCAFYEMCEAATWAKNAHAISTIASSSLAPNVSIPVERSPTLRGEKIRDDLTSFYLRDSGRRLF